MKNFLSKHQPQEVQPAFEWLLSHVHPDDRDMVEEKYEKIHRDGWLGSFDYRIVRPDGSVRYVNTVADRIVRDASRRARRGCRRPGRRRSDAPGGEGGERQGKGDERETHTFQY
jgi:hypothetical protein